MAQMQVFANLAARAAPPPRLASSAAVAPQLAASCASRAQHAAASHSRLACRAAAPHSSGGDSASSRENVKRLATLGEMQVLAALNAMPSAGENAGNEELERISSLQRSAEEARDVEERAWREVEAAQAKKA